MSFILLKWSFIILEPFLHCNILTNAFKFSTKIWGCHVMFAHHFYAKIPSGHWRFWALHQLFQSGPVALLHCNPFKYFFKNSSKCLEMSVDAYNSSSSKTQCCSLKNLSGSTSFAFWSNLVICTATLFFSLL